MQTQSESKGPEGLDPARYRELVSGLPWFRSKEDKDAFERMGLACVFACGPSAGRPLSVSWASQPGAQVSNLQKGNWKELRLHGIVWTQGPLVSQKLLTEVHRLLDTAGRRLRGQWFDVPKEMVEQIFGVAAKNLGLQVLTHPAMIARFEAERAAQINRDLASVGALN